MVEPSPTRRPVMPSAALQPPLRLVGGEFDAPPPALSFLAAVQRREAGIARENRMAAQAGEISSTAIDARDPRWILAMQTQARLQGAVLTPERRDQLLRSGKRMGLRAFEANLVIAIVQDRARRAQPFRLIEAPPAPSCDAPDHPARLGWRTWALTTLTALLLALLAIRWLAAA